MEAPNVPCDFQEGRPRITPLSLPSLRWEQGSSRVARLRPCRHFTPHKPGHLGAQECHSQFLKLDQGQVEKKACMFKGERMSGVEARFRAPIYFRTLGESFLLEDHVFTTCKTKGWDKRMVSSFLTDGTLLSLRGSRRPAGQLTGGCPGVAGNTRFGDNYWVGRGSNTCFQGQAAAGSTQKGRKKEGRGRPPCARPAPGAPLPAPGAARPSPASPAGGSHAPLAGRLPRPVCRAAVPGAPAPRRRPRPPPARRSRPR